MRFEKHGMRNMHFTIPWKALCLHITTYALKWFFLKRTVNAISGKRMFYKTPFSVGYLTYVKRALTNVC